MAINFLNNIASIGALTITRATTDPLLYLYNTTNGSGATIRFSDQTTPSQIGDITFYHSDGASQGGGASFHFASQPDTVLVVGSSINNGRFVSKSAGSAGEVDYGFYDDVNTGMYRSAADTVRLVAGGVSGVNVSVNTVDLRYAGSTKLQTTSGGVGVTGDVNTSGNANINGGNITINGSYPRFNLYSNDAGEDDWAIINNNGIFGIYNNTATDYAISIAETNNYVSINSGNLLLQGTGRIQGVDTVSANTDAANKLYVDNAVAGVPIGNYLPLTGGTLTGNLTISGGSDIFLADNGKTHYGASNDLEIYHNGTDSYIVEKGTGSLIIKSSPIIEMKGVNNEYLARFIENGSVDLYYNNSLKFETTGTGVLVEGEGIFTGNVGIGTTTPSEKLTVIGGAASRPTFVHQSGYGGIQISGPAAGSSASLIFSNDYNNAVSPEYTILMDGASDSLVFISGDPADVATQEKMRITSGGNVGIGTASPRGKLDVVGNTDNDSDFLTIQDDDPSAGSHRPSIRFRSNTAQIGQITGLDGRMIFSSGTTENSMLEIRDNGNVGIGTTNPTAKLHVTGTGLFTGLVSGITPVAAANFVTKAYADAGNARVTPATPSTITSTIVGETIEIAFNQSSTSNIDYYQVWSSDDGGDYGIIAQITPADFSSTMTVVDTTFVTGGTMSYRVFAVREGIYSTAGTTSKAYTVSALSVTDMTVVNLNTAYYIQYEKPTSRFIDHVEIYMDSQTTSAALSRSNATIVYSGQNASYMRNVNTSSNFHQFWVEIVTS
jgi:hypothetical protein